MRARLLAVDEPEWVSVLRSTRHDVYHLPEYVEVSAREERGTPTALLVEAGEAAMLVPLVIRELEGGLRDATSPYGYPGPILREGDSAFLERALAEGSRAFAEAGVVSAFIRAHPLISPPPPRLGTVVSHGATVTIDLEASADERWRAMRRDHRAHVRKSLAAGHVAELDAWDRFDAFTALYRATMDRVGASTFYFFGDEHFEALRSALKDRLHLGTVEIDGSVAAAGLFTEEDGIVEYHLSGSDPAFARSAPTKLLVHSVAEWAAARGNRRLHLGGGVGGAEDALFQFKAGFSAERHPFWTLRLVVDEAAYARLVAAHDPSRDPADRTGFFPAYRG